MANEFDLAYGHIIKTCFYLGSMSSTNGEVEVWERKEQDRIFLVDKYNEKFLSRKKEDDPEWYYNSKDMLTSLIENNCVLPSVLCSY
ncbi:MAG: hypothetical protein GYA51_14510 [Candidatus Methanofastidiosa archaeon]|nr:hypothetical protein [Candidatus Methanofastidiosa archaeon]